MSTILDTIIARKRLEVAEQRQLYSIDLLERQIEQRGYQHKLRSLSQSLRQSATGIIAEFKRRSPSKGWINQQADPTVVVQGYQQHGATASSILTDLEFFGGTLADLEAVRPLVQMPLLRKDFMIDEHQLYHARATGADVILLIAAALDQATCLQLARKAHELSLEVLLEVHAQHELDYINPYVDVVGVNNRNLNTFVTDVQTSFALARQMPADMVKISESGLSDTATVRELRQAGFEGFLMGENFMKTSDPCLALASFVQEMASQS